MAYKSAAAQGRKPNEAPVFNLGQPSAGRFDEPSSTALASIAGHLTNLTAIMEIEADQRWDG